MILIAARLMGELATYFRIPAVIGEILAGVILGPTLLGLIVASGLAMRTLAPVDLGTMRAFTLGLAGFEWRAFPADPVALVHVAGAVTLALVFPFSKLMHAPGLLFSPTLARRDRRGER